MTLTYVMLWGVVGLSYLLGYCTRAIVKQKRLAHTAAASVDEPGVCAYNGAGHQDYLDLRHTLDQRNLEWWTAELERRRKTDRIVIQQPPGPKYPKAQGENFRR
jgi:hypothetical protein